MAGFNIKEYITKKITDLDSIGNKQAAVEYFKPVSPELTRAKLTAMVKKQSFPAEFMEHVLSQDMEGANDNPPPAPTTPIAPAPARTAGPIGAPLQPMAGQGPSEEELAERGMAYEENEGPDMNNGADPDMPLMPTAGAPLRRTSDMRVISPVERVAPPAGPAQIPAPPISQDEIAQQVMEQMYAEGWRPPEEIAANVSTPTTQARLTLRRPVASVSRPIVVDANAPVRQAGAIRYATKSGQPPFRGWNESKQAFDARMANGG